MTNAKSNFFYRTFAAGAVLAGAMLVGQSAMACTLDNWSDRSNTGEVAGDPNADSIARYSGFCGMQVTGAGYVQDNNPGGINRIVARFYVLNNNTGTAEIYAGYGETDGTDELFTVTLDNAGTVTLTDTASGQQVSQNGTTEWLSVAIDWIQDGSNGRVSILVNGDEADGDMPDLIEGFANSGNPLQAVRLGNLNSAAGTLNFDAYESRRSSAVGRLLTADANNDTNVNVGDVTVLSNEIFGGTLAVGQPDCNEDGAVNVGDITCVSNIIF